MVEEGRRCLPRRLCQGLQDPGRRSAPRLGKDPPRPHRGAEIDRRGHRAGQGDHGRQRPGERHFPAELPFGQAEELEPQDPRHDPRRRALADPRGKIALKRLLFPLIALLLPAAALAAATSAEERLSEVFEAIEQKRLDDALGRADALRDEALARLRGRRERPADDSLPRNVLQLNAAQKHVLLVDSRRSRLYVFANEGGLPRYVADYYVTLGKNGIDKTREGDQKTPLGVYHVTANLPRSKLTDFYGAGAFPISY